MPEDVESAPSQLKRELNSIRNVREVYKKHGLQLKSEYKALESGEPTENFYKFIRDQGFEVKEIPLGSEYPDKTGFVQVIRPATPVKIGENKVLYVGTSGDELPKPKDLLHQASVLLLSQSLPENERVDYIKVESFNEISVKSEGRVYSRDELMRAGSITRDKSGKYAVTDALLLDAVVLGKIPYKAIKYA